MKRFPRPFSWVMLIFSTAVLTACVVALVIDPSQTGLWLTALGMLVCLCAFASALVRPKNK